jgi:hypothetical protein
MGAVLSVLSNVARVAVQVGSRVASSVGRVAANIGSKVGRVAANIGQKVASGARFIGSKMLRGIKGVGNFLNNNVNKIKSAINTFKIANPKLTKAITGIVKVVETGQQIGNASGEVIKLLQNKKEKGEINDEDYKEAFAYISKWTDLMLKTNASTQDLPPEERKKLLKRVNGEMRGISYIDAN